MGNCAGQKRPNPKPLEQPAQVEEPPPPFMEDEQKNEEPHPIETHQNLPQERVSISQEKQQSQGLSEQKPLTQPVPQEVNHEEEKKQNQEEQAAALHLEEKVEVPVIQESPPQLIQVQDDEIDVFKQNISLANFQQAFEEAINPPKRTVNFFQVGQQVLKVLNLKDANKSISKEEQFNQQIPQIIVEQAHEEIEQIQKKIQENLEYNYTNQKDDQQKENDLSPVNIPIGKYVLVNSDNKMDIRYSIKQEKIDLNQEVQDFDRQIIAQVDKELLQVKGEDA